MQDGTLEYQRDQRIRAILEAIPDDMLLVDPEGNIREYKAGRSATHLPMDRFLGTTLGELFAPDVAQVLQRAACEVLAGEPARYSSLAWNRGTSRPGLFPWKKS